MEMLSEDDLNLRQITPEELDLAWDLWFDLAQATNDFDPPYTHGVFVLCQPQPAGEPLRGGSGRIRLPATARPDGRG